MKNNDLSERVPRNVRLSIKNDDWLREESFLHRKTKSDILNELMDEKRKEK